MKLIPILLTSIVIISCAGNQNELPTAIIPQDKIVDVIADVELTQAVIKLKFSNKDSLINQTQLFNEVFIKHNTTEEQFNTSLAFYAKQPLVMDTIYVQVITKLSKKQAENQ